MDKPKTGLEDYVRDVPIELFTVSKMVISANTFMKEKQSQQDQQD